MRQCKEGKKCPRSAAANAAGALVIELLPYNWEWKGISRLYKNLTVSVGDIHHFAWRARHPRFAVYMSPDDARYAEWAAEECQSRCVGVPNYECWKTSSHEGCNRRTPVLQAGWFRLWYRHSETSVYFLKHSLW